MRKGICLMRDAKAPNELKKFLFDHHIFDAPEVEEEEDPSLLPILFTEEQMEQAKKESYAKGHKDGVEESRISRESHIADILKAIASALPALQKAESARELAYEHEVLSLVLLVVRKILPHFVLREGSNEIFHVLERVLQDVRGQNEILIEVPTGLISEIEAYLQTLHAHQESVRYSVREDDSLRHGDCKVYWRDGGAVRQASALLAEIESSLALLLEDSQKGEKDSQG